MDVYPPSQIVRWDQTNIKPISGIETYTLINVFMEKNCYSMFKWKMQGTLESNISN